MNLLLLLLLGDDEVEEEEEGKIVAALVEDGARFTACAGEVAVGGEGMYLQGPATYYIHYIHILYTLYNMHTFHDMHTGTHPSAARAGSAHTLSQTIYIYIIL